jgi:hypothetical protein
MSKGERHGNREVKKPKRDKPKVIAAAPSAKGGSNSRVVTARVDIKK